MRHRLNFVSALTFNAGKITPNKTITKATNAKIHESNAIAEPLYVIASGPQIASEPPKITIVPLTAVSLLVETIPGVAIIKMNATMPRTAAHKPEYFRNFFIVSPPAIIISTIKKYIKNEYKKVGIQAYPYPFKEPVAKTNE